MTEKQLKESTTKELLVIYKNKARCVHSEHKAEKVYREIENRLGSKMLYSLRLETHHMQNGEGDSTFNDECDKLIDLVKIEKKFDKL